MYADSLQSLHSTSCNADAVPWITSIMQNAGHDERNTSVCGEALESSACDSKSYTFVNNTYMYAVADSGGSALPSLPPIQSQSPVTTEYTHYVHFSN